MPNPTGKGGWTKGQSGNPGGRPKKHRELTAILKRGGSRTREDTDGKRRSGKRIMARALWELASTGHASLPREDGSEYQIVVGGAGWFDIVKWLYQHIDGPPKLRTEVSGPDGGPIETKAVRPNVPQFTDDELGALAEIAGRITGDPPGTAEA